jgi:GT2 family glycosyltransferase
LWRNIAHWFRYRINPRFNELSGDEVVAARVLNGVCLLIRTACLRQIGLFDENIFMYVEDVEMDYRARRAGWKIQYLPIDSVVHQQKLEGYHMTSLVSFLLKRNAVYYLCKIGKRLDAWCYAALSLALLLLRSLVPYERANFREHLQFSKKLALAYRRILLNQPFDKSFGPPFD